MAVFRVEKTKDFTIMSNHHLRNTELSLKAKGLLSLMLSLPEDWDYTTKGLAHICKDGVDSITTALKELERHGYLTRQRLRYDNGQLGDIEYTIHEQPVSTENIGLSPKRENPRQVKPEQAKPKQAEPEQENPAQLNTNPLKTHHFTTLQMISLSANQPFYGIHQPCRFYSCFDVFDETDVKYLFLNFLADEKTEVLYAFTAVCGKIFFLIRQQFHCAVADIDQVD